VAACFEHGNEPSGSIKYVEFVDKLSDYQFLLHMSRQIVKVKYDMFLVPKDQGDVLLKGLGGKAPCILNHGTSWVSSQL
jgi:hypothetical protein